MLNMSSPKVNPITQPLISSRYLLDSLQKEFGATYGFRRITSFHLLSCRVRRSTDNAKLDIGFIGDELDTVSLLSFIGSDSGYIEILYDGSGNGNHLTQSDSTKQPRIVNAGTLETDGAKPSMYFDGSNDVLICNNSTSLDIISQPLYLNAVVNFDSSLASDCHFLVKNTDASSNFQYMLGFSNANTRVYCYIEGTSNLAYQATSSITKGVQSIASATWINSIMKCYKNGVNTGIEDTYSGSLTSRSYLHIGARGNVGGTQATFFKGKIAEINIMRSNNKQIQFEQDQKRYFGIA